MVDLVCVDAGELGHPPPRSSVPAGEGDAAAAGDGPGMTTRPGIWCCRTVGLATRMLPPVHRQRYGMEFIAELYGMTPAQQRRHSARVLSSAWALRSALGAAAPTTLEEAMTSVAPPDRSPAD